MQLKILVTTPIHYIRYLLLKLFVVGQCRWQQSRERLVTISTASDLGKTRWRMQWVFGERFTVVPLLAETPLHRLSLRCLHLPKLSLAHLDLVKAHFVLG